MFVYHLGGLTAPQIIASMVHVLGCTPTTSTLLASMTEVLLSYGPTTLTSSLATLGAGVSSVKMFHRIQLIKQFELDPLQPPQVEDLSQSLAQININPDISAHDSVNNNNNNSYSRSSECILISGPLKEFTDERVLWGADSFTETIIQPPDTNDSNPTSDNSSVYQTQLDTSWDNISGVKDTRVTGWWRQVVDPNHTQQVNILHWDTTELHRLYHAQEHFFLDKGFSMASEQFLMASSSIISAASIPITLLDRLSEIDCPWLVVMNRAEQAGKLLAESILNKIKKSPNHIIPITLIGYGMGARVIYHCLQSLLLQSTINVQGVLENVILIGAPVGVNVEEWISFRSIVVNRFVNCYRENDWLLYLLYRYRSWDINIAGLKPIIISSTTSPIGPKSTTNVNENFYHTIENIDITDCIVSNYDYSLNLENIFKRIYSINK